jgi:hypothetical protein
MSLCIRSGCKDSKPYEAGIARAYAHEFGIEDDVIEYISLNVIEVFKHVQ